MRGEISQKYYQISVLQRKLKFLYRFIDSEYSKNLFDVISYKYRAAQLNEALQMQMEVERRLSDQLEVYIHIFPDDT